MATSTVAAAAGARTSAAAPVPAFGIEQFLPTALLFDGGDRQVHVASCILTPQYSAVSVARRFARRVVRGWYAEHLSDDVSIVVSELVANAMRHGVDLGGQEGCSGWIELRLLYAGDRLLCAVNDPSADVPVRRDPDQAAGSGRGLQLIDSLCQFWGWTAVERDGHRVGKAVWAVLPSRERLEEGAG